MREEAQKEGWAKATKLQDRPMSQGLVGLISDENSATLVEVRPHSTIKAPKRSQQKLYLQSAKFQKIISKKVLYKLYFIGNS